MPKSFTWEQLLEEELDFRNEKVENIICIYPKDFDLKVINPAGNFVVWTENYIYFSERSDFGDNVASLPRNPPF